RGDGEIDVADALVILVRAGNLQEAGVERVILTRRGRGFRAGRLLLGRLLNRAAENPQRQDSRNCRTPEDGIGFHPRVPPWVRGNANYPPGAEETQSQP